MKIKAEIEFKEELEPFDINHILDSFFDQYKRQIKGMEYCEA